MRYHNNTEHQVEYHIFEGNQRVTEADYKEYFSCLKKFVACLFKLKL